jgi:Glycosyltransferase
MVIQTHPVQYHAPIYRVLQQRFGIETHVIYGSDFSVAGGLDPRFGKKFAWDTDLLSGYQSHFLSRVSNGAPASVEGVTARGLQRLLNELRPAAVMIVGYNRRFHQHAIFAALSTRLPILFRAEVNDYAGVRHPLKDAIRLRVLRRLYRRFDAFLYLGQRSREHYERHGCPADKLFFSPYCADYSVHEKHLENSESKTEIRRSLGISQDATVIMFTGKLYEAKGPGVLIEAVRRLPEQRRKRTELLLVGDGEMRGDLEALVRREPVVKAHFTGFRNQTELGRFYKAVDLLVLPSFSETWGLVVNEALFYGLPCVVTDRVGCAPDLVLPGVNGEVCQARSADSLVAALQRSCRLIGDPGVAEVCRQLVDRYSLENAAKGIRDAHFAMTGRKHSIAIAKRA